jgi:hypothetical protein
MGYKIVGAGKEQLKLVNLAGKVVTFLGNKPNIKAVGTIDSMYKALFKPENMRTLCDLWFPG